MVTGYYVHKVNLVEFLFVIFRCHRKCQVDFNSTDLDKANNQPHIANTYVALVMLLILGDNLQDIRREAVGESLRKWQLEDR